MPNHTGSGNVVPDDVVPGFVVDRVATLHKLTTQFATELGHLTVEDLHAAGMMRSKPARHLDAALGELGRQLSTGPKGTRCSRGDRLPTVRAVGAVADGRQTEYATPAGWWAPAA